MQAIAPLVCEIQEYAWGSHTALGELLGLPTPTAAPQAELWMGAHPTAPSRVRLEGREVPLPLWIRRDPEGVLGAEVARRFGGELPFLVKVLAAEQPLSIQAHPDLAQAEAGFARENAAGIPLGAPERSYRDPHPKPELVCALTPFQALRGFRPISAALERLEALALPALAESVSAFRSDPTRRGLARFFHGILTLPEDAHAPLAAGVAERAAVLASRDRAFDWVSLLARHHPEDPLILAPLLLNAIELAPGQALYLDSGEPHAYLGGVAIEAMASSDNVLRGGLTSKHIDVPELMRVLTFDDGEPEILEPRPVAGGVAVYPTPAPHFELAVVGLAAGAEHAGQTSRGVEIWVCTEGEGRVETDGGSLDWRRGSVWLVPAAVGAYRVRGEGVCYRASAGARA